MDDTPETDRPRRSKAPLAIGALVALAAGLGAALVVSRMGGSDDGLPPPASQGGLVIESGPDTAAADAAKPLRCFVAGQFVGDLTLAECAKRNGVATDALDVGLDETGSLAAAQQQAGAMLTPLPPEAVAAEPADAEQAAVASPAGPADACWRHQNGKWRRLPGDLGLDACVQTLFAGRCLKAGQAQYGRWGHQTLRLVTGKVEVSDDNQIFRTLAPQDAACAIAPAG